ncbi:acetyltransferase [Rhodopirellula islandica]|uniref:acetyltransferase n=1 Tax=Rhodopirellula islandica TaxID=595434 RepID=UPI0021BBDEB7|nr:acetyltransferase [Rhodopirellula islandica]
MIWGSAGHALVLNDIIELQGGRVIQLFDNNKNASSSIPGVELLYGETEFRRWVSELNVPVASVFGLVAIGGSFGRVRNHYHQMLKNSGLKVPSLISSDALVSKASAIGNGTQVLPNAIVASGTRIGDACILNHGSQVDHECELEHGVHLAPGAILCGCVKVGCRSMVGAGATVLPRIAIGADTIIGAGAVVTRDIPDRVIAFGNPARVVRQRREDELGE